MKRTVIVGFLSLALSGMIASAQQARSAGPPELLLHIGSSSTASLEVQVAHIAPGPNAKLSVQEITTPVTLHLLSEVATAIVTRTGGNGDVTVEFTRKNADGTTGPTVKGTGSVVIANHWYGEASITEF